MQNQLQVIPSHNSMLSLNLVKQIRSKTGHMPLTHTIFISVPGI